MKLNWSIPKQTDFQTSLHQYRRYIQERGLKESTIIEYEGNLLRYLKFSETDKLYVEDWERLRETLFDRKMKRYAYASRAYHDMIGTPITIHRIEPNNQIPFASRKRT
jgi:hypothetical protein